MSRESKHKLIKRSSQRVAGQRAAAGFTLIELLVVIVVIAILAAVSVVAYRGISNRASDTAVKSDLAQMYKSYKLNTVEDDFDVDDHIGSEYIVRDGKHLHQVAKSGQDKLKQLFGLTPDRSHYYDQGDEISVIFTIEVVEHYDQSADRYRYERVPVMYARSASGKVFRHDGRITQDLGSASSESADELRDNIDFYEYEINRIDACYSGSAPAEECGDMSGWPPISEWPAEKEGALLQVAEWRRILNELDNLGYSLSSHLPECTTTYAFLQSESQWYLHDFCSPV